MLLVRHLYTSIHHEVKGLMKGTPSIHPSPPLTYILGSGVSCHINLEWVFLWLWCELSYEFEASCLRASLMRGDVGARCLIHHDTAYMLIVCLVWSIKPKVEIESTLEKFWMSASISIKFQLYVHIQEECFELTFDRLLVFTCCSTMRKNEG